jgi:ribosomal RNA-processing protein 12
MDEALAKIRPHTTSSLPHQKAPATLLRALESTFDEQNTERSPTAYYAALLTTLDGTIQRERASGLSLEEGDVLPSELYLLSIITPFVPHPVVRTHLDTLISLTSPLFPVLHTHAPPLRSQLALYSAIFAALDRPQLETPGVRQSFATILQLTLDSRPKVRRKAVDVIREMLESPPAPMLHHPYAERVAEWVKTALAEASANPISKIKGKKVETDGSDTAIHLLAFIRPILLKLPPSVSTFTLKFSLGLTSI